MTSKVKVDTIEQQGSSGIVLSHDVKLASGTAIKNAAGTALLTEAGALDNVALGSSVTGLPSGGISVFDAWRIHTSFSTAATPIVNWEREDNIHDSSTTMPGTLQIVGLSETSSNSGIFTFPSTGKYLMWLQLCLVNTTSQWAYMKTQLSFDTGSSWKDAAIPYHGSADGSSYYHVMTSVVFINVSNTSTMQMRFSMQNQSTFSVFGSSTGTGTGFKIVKFGDYVS